MNRVPKMVLCNTTTLSCLKSDEDEDLQVPLMFEPSASCASWGGASSREIRNFYNPSPLGFEG